MPFVMTEETMQALVEDMGANVTPEGWMKFVVGPTMAKVMREAGVPESQIVESKPLPTGHP